MLSLRTGLCVAAATSLLLTGCGDEEAQTPGAQAEVVQEGEALAEVPAPEGDPVLWVHGATGEANDGEAIAFDLATLERLRLEEWTVYETFVDADVTFRGVPLAFLLDVVGVPADATEVVLVALDDYEIALTIEDARSGDALVATRDTGEAIPLDAGGPIRLVFADGTDLAQNPDLWIWSIRDLTFQ